MPEWKRKLIEKKRLKAAAEAEASSNGGQAPPPAGQAAAKPADEGDSECQMMEGFLFKRDGGACRVVCGVCAVSVCGVCGGGLTR
jgi:hypothetical protein